MGTMQAAVSDQNAKGGVAIREIEAPAPSTNEALVRTAATAMTPNEVWYSYLGYPNRALGCDVVGVVEQQAADGSGPGAGARVIGRVDSGAWAELVAVPTDALAEIPDNLSFEDAATLPTSGLTALYVLEKGWRLLDEDILITGANGSVGLFACQIGKLMGARVIGQVWKEQYRDMVEQCGADFVTVTKDAEAAREFGPYKLISESIGGQVLSNCMTMIAPDGICVSFGNASGQDSTFNAWKFIMQPRACVYAFIISNEFNLSPASIGLAKLARLVSEGKLKSHIGVEARIDDIGDVAQEIAEHKIEGKAVIRMWI